MTRFDEIFKFIRENGYAQVVDPESGGWTELHIKTMKRMFRTMNSPEEFYNEDEMTNFINRHVVNPIGGWFHMVQGAALEMVQEAAPGDEIWEAMEMRVLSMKRSDDDE